LKVFNFNAGKFFACAPSRFLSCFYAFLGGKEQPQYFQQNSRAAHEVKLLMIINLHFKNAQRAGREQRQSILKFGRLLGSPVSGEKARRTHKMPRLMRPSGFLL
jgi:hypothetical protein